MVERSSGVPLIPNDCCCCSERVGESGKWNEGRRSKDEGRRSKVEVRYAKGRRVRGKDVDRAERPAVWTHGQMDMCGWRERLRGMDHH